MRGNVKEILEKVTFQYEKSIIKNSLKKLTINNFRAFEKDTVLNFNFPLVVLVGKNGAGKSTVLKLIKTLSKKQNIQNCFPESDLDPGDIGKSYVFTFNIEGNDYINVKKKKRWIVTNDSNDINKIETMKNIDDYLKTKDIDIPNINICDIEFKVMIGAFDKSIYFDNISRSKNISKRVSDTLKQSKKIIQNKNDKSSNKRVTKLTSSEIKEINYILDKNYVDISICEHRYFNGKWGITVLFSDDKKYSEFNSGSGEFVIANAVNKISKLPSNSILILDEPETSIHPGAQKRFMEYLFKIILSKKIQVIISTHSPSIIEELPNMCIKNFVKNFDNTIQVNENVNYREAFHNLECSYDKKNIIVEDELAKNILLSICKEEKYINLFNIDYYSGGAESIKTLLITAFSKSETNNRFIIFDGDKFNKDAIDLDSILEKDKDLEFYKKEFKSVTGVNWDSIKWGINGNRESKNGQKTNSELSVLIAKYLKFYRNNVFFFPQRIPEEIIFDIDYISRAYSYVDLTELNKITSYKEKFLRLSDITGIDVNAIENNLIAYFVKSKKTGENYKKLKETLDKILVNSK